MSDLVLEVVIVTNNLLGSGQVMAGERACGDGYTLCLIHGHS